MAEQIGVEIVPQDAQFIASTQKASAAMAALAAQEERLGKVAAAAGLDQKKFVQQFAKVEASRQREEQNTQRATDTAARIAARAAATADKKAAADKATAERRAAKAADIAAKADAIAKKKAIADKARDERNAAAEIDRAEKKRIAKSNQLYRVLLGRKAVILGEATGIGKAGVAAVELGGALVAAGTALEAILVSVGVLAVQTAQSKKNAKEFFDVLTNGRGDKTLSLVDGLATQLGVSLEKARGEFEQFRQAGLDNKQSAKLIKLVADLDSVDRSGELAKQAVDRVLSYASNGPQTADQAAAATKAMALLAKQAGVAGDGTAAAKDSVTSLTGALGRIDNNKIKALEQIGEKIQPSLDRAAQALAKVSDALLKSKEGQKLLDTIATSLSKIADEAERAGPKLEQLIKDGTIQKGVDDLGELKDAAWEVGSAALEIPKAFWVVASNINDAVNYIAAPFEDLGITIYKDVVAAVPKMIDAGESLISGLIQGIEGGAARLAVTVTDMAGSVKDAFKHALGIKSPSKVFAQYGINTGEGYNRGLDRSMPDGAEMADRMLPAPPARAVQNIFNQAAPASAVTQAGASSSTGPSLTINLHGSATEEDAGRARKQFELWWRGINQQQGNA